MLFSVQTKNVNWEILTQNLATFKRWDGFLAAGEGGQENRYIMGIAKKGVAWTIYTFERGLGKKRVDTPMNTMMMGKREQLLSTKHDLLHFLPLQFCYSLKICGDKLWWSIMVKTWNSTSSKYQSSQEKCLKLRLLIIQFISLFLRVTENSSESKNNQLFESL